MYLSDPGLTEINLSVSTDSEYYIIEIPVFEHAAIVDVWAVCYQASCLEP
jgi:hypothetical protein